MKLLAEPRILAPELPPVGWAGHDGRMLRELRGKIVLLDFFSYADPAGMRALGFVRALEERYRFAGLRVVGVHVPAYDFERPEEVARLETWRIGIPYPVALDQTFAIWQAYENRDLPARWLVDENGFARAWHHGPGGLPETEAAVRALLSRAGAALPPPVGAPEPRPGELTWLETPEVRFGVRGVGFGPPEDPRQTGESGEIGKTAEEAREGTTRTFGELPESRAQGRPYLRGTWRLGEERVVSESEGASLSVVFEGSSVAAVVSWPEGDEEGASESSPELQLRLDGTGLPREARGADVEGDPGSARIPVARGRLYELISSIEFGIHHLEIATRGRGVAFHLLSFGTSVVDERVPGPAPSGGDRGPSPGGAAAR